LREKGYYFEIVEDIMYGTPCAKGPNPITFCWSGLAMYSVAIITTLSDALFLRIKWDMDYNYRKVILTIVK
jgi:hypothetical protein